MQSKKMKNNTTINSLASMVQRGFIETNENIKKEVGDLRFEMNERFDNLEKIVLGEHRERIFSLEERMKTLEHDFRVALGGKR